MNRFHYQATVRVPADKSHTGEARNIVINIWLEAVNTTEATQRASDVGKTLGLLLIGPL